MRDASPAPSVAPQPGRAYLALLFITALWGAAYPVLKIAVLTFTWAPTICLRFALAALLVLPLAWRHLGHRRAARAGVVLGLINFALFSLMSQAIAILPAARTAFLMGTSVILVPLMDAALARKWPTTVELSAAALGMLGVMVMTGYRPGALAPADGWVLLASLLTAVGILVLQRFAEAGPLPETALVFYLMLTVALTAAPVAWYTMPAHLDVGLPGVLALVYGAALANVLSYTLQVRYQPHTKPSLAALIYTLKPLFAALVAWPLFAEPVSVHFVIGAAIIFAASWLQPALDARPIAT